MVVTTCDMTILSTITGEEKIFHGKIYIKIDLLRAKWNVQQEIMESAPRFRGWGTSNSSNTHTIGRYPRSTPRPDPSNPQSCLPTTPLSRSTLRSTSSTSRPSSFPPPTRHPSAWLTSLNVLRPPPAPPRNDVLPLPVPPSARVPVGIVHVRVSIRLPILQWSLELVGPFPSKASSPWIRLFGGSVGNCRCIPSIQSGCRDRRRVCDIVSPIERIFCMPESRVYVSQQVKLMNVLTGWLFRNSVTSWSVYGMSAQCRSKWGWRPSMISSKREDAIWLRVKYDNGVVGLVVNVGCWVLGVIDPLRGPGWSTGREALVSWLIRLNTLGPK